VNTRGNVPSVEGPHLLEQPVHTTVAQQPHVADRVRAGDQGRNQREDLHGRVRAALHRELHLVSEQHRQPTPRGHRHHRNSPDLDLP
jgi:hypothetical protein